MLKEEWDIVESERESSMGRFKKPRWRRVWKREVEAMIGVALPL